MNMSGTIYNYFRSRLLNSKLKINSQTLLNKYIAQQKIRLLFPFDKRNVASVRRHPINQEIAGQSQRTDRDFKLQADVSGGITSVLQRALRNAFAGRGILQALRTNVVWGRRRLAYAAQWQEPIQEVDNVTEDFRKQKDHEIISEKYTRKQKDHEIIPEKYTRKQNDHEIISEKHTVIKETIKQVDSVELKKSLSRRRKIKSKDFQVHFLKYDIPCNCVIRNTGKTFIMTLARKETQPSIVIQRDLSRMDYNLNNIFFHWPGRHIVENRRYDLEVCMHHKNALTDQTLMLVFLFQVSRKRNQDYHTSSGHTALAIIAGMLTEPGDSLYVRDVVIGDIIGSHYNTNYYSYMGTLEYPSVQSDVVWLVQSKPITIGRKQYEMILKARKGKYQNMGRTKFDHTVQHPIIFFE